jgi:threonine dehydratase
MLSRNIRGELSAPTLEEIRLAQKRIAGIALRTPLIRLNVDNAPGEIYLKMENLQPIGSFKIRPALNAILSAPAESTARGVYTASSGNMAQGVAYSALHLGLEATVLLPDNAPQGKIAALRRQGAIIKHLSHEDWWQVLLNHGHPGEKGLFIHPVSNRDVLAGDATVGAEIYEDLPDVDTVVVPFGGGGLSCGIAAAFKALKSDTRIIAAESAHCAPLTASLAKACPTDVPCPATFISGIGTGTVLADMWPVVSEMLAETVVASIEEIVDAIRLLFERNRIVAEGAGAAPVASALAGRAGGGKIVCVISGGNLDAKYMIDILQGKIPVV